MLTLLGDQADLANRAGQTLVPLIKLTTYLIYPTTVSQEFYWSSVPVWYDFDGAGDQYFRDVIRGISELDLQMPHLPLNQGNQIGTPILSLTIANDEIDGEALWKTLRGELTTFSLLEYAELLVDPQRFTVEGGSAWWDLRDLAGTYHTYRFRGELQTMEIVEDDHTFTLSFQATVPEVPVVELLSQTENDPRDFGSILPIVYGQAKRVPCKNILVGWSTTLAETISKTYTGLAKVTDAAGFPTASTFDFLAGTEQIRCSGSDHTDHTVTITTRGYNSSRKAPHTAGDVILELLDEIVAGAAGHRCALFRRLYVRNPFSETLLRFPATYLFNEEDRGSIAGETICSVTITREEMLQFAEAAYQNAQVKIQPVYETGATTGATDSALPTGTPKSEAPTTGGHYGRWTSETSSGPTIWPHWQGNKSLPYPYALTRSFAGMGGLDATERVLRWKFGVEIDVIDTPDSYETGVICRVYDVPGISNGATISVERTQSQGPGQSSIESEWFPADGNPTMDTLNTAGAYMKFWGLGSHGKDFEIIDFYVAAETGTPGGIANQLTEAEIEAASIGYGLQFYADVDGYPVPYEYNAGYGFEATGWAASVCTVVRDTTHVEGSYSVKATGATGNCVGQLTSIGGHGTDLTATDLRYRISIRVANPELLDPDEMIEVWFSNASATGTTPPADRIEFKIDPAFLVNVTWVDLEVDAYAVGSSPSVTAIDTIGFSFGVSSGAPILWIDDLRPADSDNSDYDDAPGTLIEKMPDIGKHFIADHCGLGHAAIGTSFATARTRLDDNVYAGAVTLYGQRFEEILGGLAFEGRGNIIREEGAAGSVYEYHAANQPGQVYQYTQMSRDLSERNRLTERQRPAGQAATRFRSYWGFDPSLGLDSESFTQVSRGDLSVNDTPIALLNFTLAEIRYGRRDADPFAFYLIHDEETSEDVLGFYAHESVNHARSSWELVVPNWLAFDLQRGDVLFLTPAWAPAAKRARVVGIRRSFAVPTSTVTLVEVLAS